MPFEIIFREIESNNFFLEKEDLLYYRGFNKLCSKNLDKKRKPPQNNNGFQA